MFVVNASGFGGGRIAMVSQWKAIELDRTIADMTETDTSLSSSRSMRMFDRHAIDIRLVAAVQINAGARCHEAANLLNCYGLASKAYESSVSHQACDRAAEDLKLIEQSECALRKFLFECRAQQLIPQGS